MWKKVKYKDWDGKEYYMSLYYFNNQNFNNQKLRTK